MDGRISPSQPPATERPPASEAPALALNLKRLCSRRGEVSFFLFTLGVRAGLSRKMRRLREQAQQLRQLGLVDEQWYRDQYGELDGALLDPVLHYLRKGVALRCNPNPLFSTSWFIKKYRKRIPKGENPLLHYVLNGIRDGLNPSSLFDTRAYAARHPELERQGIHPLAHRLATEPLDCLKDFPVPAAGRIRVAYVSGEPETPGEIYRVQMYAAAVAKQGHAVRSFNLFDISLCLKALEQAQVIVLWRCMWDGNVELILTLARRTGARVVFDIDDLLFEPELAYGDTVDALRFEAVNRGKKAAYFAGMRQTALASDFFSTPTEPLRAALCQLGKPGVLLPNGFDEETVRRTREAVTRRRNGPGDGWIRIGYAGGTRTHQKDFACAAPAIAAVLRRHPECRLVLFRMEDRTHGAECLDLSEFPEFAGLEGQVEWWPVRPLRELPEALARFDINLAPLEHGKLFCEAKSELKYFEAALAEVPTVASPTIPYAQAMRHGETGFLAANGSEWEACLEMLVTDPTLRATLGKAAYADILHKYGPERRAELVGAMLEHVLAVPA